MREGGKEGRQELVRQPCCSKVMGGGETSDPYVSSLPLFRFEVSILCYCFCGGGGESAVSTLVVLGLYRISNRSGFRSWRLR